MKIAIIVLVGILLLEAIGLQLRPPHPNTLLGWLSISSQPTDNNLYYTKNTVPPPHLQVEIASEQKKEEFRAPQIKFQHIGAQQGLSQGHGVCIFQDSEGFMWFGTMDGLNKYDGYQITVYRNNPQDTALLSNNFITCIYEDRQKNFWMGTRNGLDRLDRKKGKFIHYKNTANDPKSISNNSIHAIYEDKKGNLWIGTNGGGLNLYHPTKDNFTHYLPDTANPSSISDNYVNVIYEDNKGSLWVGTRSGGINHFNLESQSFTCYKNQAEDPNSLSSNNITSILEDRQGNFWVSTWGGGLNLFDRYKKTFSHYRHKSQDTKSIASDIIYGMLEDHKGNLWLGTENGGLNLYNHATKNFIHYTHHVNDLHSLANNTVSALYEDTSGNIWVGVHRAGIDYFNPDDEKFRHYYQQAGDASLSNNNVQAFWEDRQGKLWIGTDGGGLNLLDRTSDTFTHFRSDKNKSGSISSDVVLAIMEDRTGKLWLGTWQGGLNLFDSNKNTSKAYFHKPSDTTSISSNKPWVIWEDRKENIWIGTYDGGLNWLDKQQNKFIRFQHQSGQTNSLCNNQVKAIREDKEGNLWIGTANGLDLLNLNTHNFIHYISDPKQVNSLSSNDINTLLIDHQGNLWIGTQKGLNLYNKKTNNFTVFTEKDGLCNNAVQGILEDERGNLWISTLNGLSKFNPAQKIFQNFSITDGLQGNEFLKNACLKTKDGKLYFGGINGFNVFHPDAIKDNPFIPPVHLTDFQLFNHSVSITDQDSPLQQPINQSKEITLSYEQSVISFEFVALNYRSPEKNQYAYRLEGFDQGWNYVGNQRKATYTNLDPGQYIFRVKASNNDGVWNHKGTFIRLNITPPFWKTLWFRASGIFLIILLALTAHRTTTKLIIARNKALEAKVMERTREIERQKQEIALHLENLQNVNEQIIHQKEDLARKIAERTQELQANHEELLLLTNALPVLITYVDQQQRYRFNNKTYEDWFGTSRAQVYGQHLLEGMGEKAYAQVKHQVERVLTGESLHEETWMAYPKLGNRFVSIDYIPHWRDGQVVGYYTLIADITDQQKSKQALEEALNETRQSNEALKKTNIDLDNFVYTASHDLKSPIANLEGITSLLIRKLEGKLDEKQKEMLSMIHTMTHKLKATIADLTEISRVQKDLDQEQETISFEQVLNDVQADLYKQITESGAVITTNWEEKEIPYARKNLRSILYNLVTNAIKYRSPNRTLHIHLQTQRQGHGLMLLVADNGLGVASHQLPKLFLMFKRLHTHVEGTGIGLYITKRIIENNGGHILVESEEGKGSVFKVFFKL
jgi:PAS domain S-box-containing protein